jgi:hypothetical protein
MHAADCMPSLQPHERLHSPPGARGVQSAPSSGCGRVASYTQGGGEPRLVFGLVASTAGWVEAMGSQVRAKSMSTVRVAPGRSRLDDPLGYAMRRLGGQSRPRALGTSRGASGPRLRAAPDSPSAEEIEAEVATRSDVVLGNGARGHGLKGGRNGYR